MTVTDSRPLEPVYEVPQVAEHLNCTAETIYKLVAEGKLRAIRVGRLVRVPESAITEFISSPGK